MCALAINLNSSRIVVILLLYIKHFEDYLELPDFLHFTKETKCQKSHSTQNMCKYLQETRDLSARLYEHLIA